MDEISQGTLRLARVVGLFPYSSKYEFTLWRMLVVIVSYSAFTYFQVNGFLSIDHLQKRMIFLCHWVLLSLLLFTHFAVICLSVSKIEKFFQNLEYFVTIMNWEGIDISYTHDRRKKIIFFISLPSVLLLAIYFSISLDYIFKVGIWSYLLAVSLISEHVYRIVFTIKISFSSLKFIREHKRLLSNNDLLMSLCKIVDDCYGPQLFLLTSCVFFATEMLLLSFLYEFINWMNTSLFIFTFVYPFCKLIVTTNGIILQGRNINKLLYRRLLAYPNDELLEFHLIAKRDITFTGCGFIYIENSLLGSMIRAGVTYLVILMQYKR